jgi:hypothetical protein
MRIRLDLDMPTMEPSRMRPLLSPAISLLAPFLALAACEDTQLPNLTVPMGDNTTFGTDLRADDPVLGITVIDPLGRLPG